MAKVLVTYQSCIEIDIPDERLLLDKYHGTYYKYFIDDNTRRKTLQEIANKFNIELDDILYITDEQTDVDIYERD